MKDLGELLQRLGIARIAAMAVVAVMLLGFFAFLIMRSTMPQMAPLYTGLTLEDSGAIISELNAMGMAYELRGEGDTILVPRDQITTTRMTLAQSGLPQRGQMGYEIFDQQSALGATSFVQNINHVRALEGELARTITALARVQSARVHLVLPERELFSRDMKDPSASIVLSARGQPSSGEIAAIQHLVASAIQGLTPNAVAVVDDAGTLLASGSGADETSVTAQAIEERVVGIESRLRNRIEELLASVVGSGRARVQVAAELDLNRSTVTSETFDPDSQVARSSQVRETEDQSTGPGNTGEVTVANELPGATENGGEGTAQQSTALEQTTNYEISRTTETLVNEAGDIKRLSVAVVVDGVYTYDAQGNPTYEARSPEQIEQITNLVRTAMGFDSARGDQIEVVNMQFAQRPDISIGTAEPGLFDFTRDDLMKFAEMAVTLMIALALVVFIMRPLIRKVIAPEAKPLALPPTSAVATTEYQDEDTEDPELAAKARDAAADAWMMQAKSLGESQVKAIRMVGELVEENPKQASLIVRDWLSSAA